jgi:hypothetical protein
MPSSGLGLSALTVSSSILQLYRHIHLTPSDGNCNTLCYGSPNLTLTTVISGLVMRDATGLINSESS